MIDLHCDTIYALWKNGRNGSLVFNDLSVNRDSLIQGGARGQCFALFTPMRDLVPEVHRGKTPWMILKELHGIFEEEIAKAGIPKLEHASDLSDGILHAILTTEEGASIEGDISRLEVLKDWGVRIFGLTWNWENELAYPNSSDRAIMSKGLKEKGFEAVEECNRLGIIIDVSHLSDGGFMDVASSTSPMISFACLRTRAALPASTYVRHSSMARRQGRRRMPRAAWRTWSGM